MRVAIPRFGECVAPCFEYSATITIFDVKGQRVKGHTDFNLHSQNPFDRIRLLRDQGVQTLICGGVESRIEDVIQASGIRVLSWVSGNVDELLDLFIHGRLLPQSDRHAPPRTTRSKKRGPNS